MPIPAGNRYRKPQTEVPTPAINQIWKAAQPANAPCRRIYQITDGWVRCEPVYFARNVWHVDRASLQPMRPARIAKFTGKLTHGHFLYVEG